jgi:hypothetical protein
MNAEDCEKLGGTMESGVCTVEYKGGQTGRLKSGGFADLGIIPIIDDLNAKGCPTVASCSGLKSDHYGHKEGAYMSVEMPDHVVRADAGGHIFDVDPRNVLKPSVVQCFINAGGRANWRSKLTKYMTFIPTVSFHLPHTKFVQTDKDAESEPDLVAAEDELDSVMKRRHSMDEFFTALHKRDGLKEKAYIKHGKDPSYWTDERVAIAWAKLQKEVAPCCALLGSK